MSSQLQNIAPAPPPTNPQQMQTQPQMSQMAAPGTPSTGAHPSHPLMSPGGHPIPQMGQQVATAGPGQYQIIQAGAPNAATAQYLAQPQVATYNQHGQIVLQPANFAGMQIMQAATQQPGQQQYILAAATPQSAVPGQKPGQPQMIASSPQQQGSGKAITPGSQATSGYTITAPGMVSPATGTAGAGQTYIMANPMTGSLMSGGQPMGQIPSSMASHIKPEPGKTPQQPLPGVPSQGQPQPSATPHQPHPSQPTQAVMLQPGMTYMQAPQQQQGQAQTQAVFQNGQLYLRAQNPQDGLMFSQQGQLISQQPMQGASAQQMPPGLTPGIPPADLQGNNHGYSSTCYLASTTPILLELQHARMLLDSSMQGPRKSVRLVRIFLDKSKSCGQFWSETTSETNRQTVNGHFIACPCHRQLSIVWINSLSVDKFTFFCQLSIIRTNVHGMDNCSYYFITCLCHRHKTCFFVAKLTK